MKAAIIEFRRVARRRHPSGKGWVDFYQDTMSERMNLPPVLRSEAHKRARALGMRARILKPTRPVKAAA